MNFSLFVDGYSDLLLVGRVELILVSSRPIAELSGNKDCLYAITERLRGIIDYKRSYFHKIKDVLLYGTYRN